MVTRLWEASIHAAVAAMVFFPVPGQSAASARPAEAARETHRRGRPAKPLALSQRVTIWIDHAPTGSRAPRRFGPWHCRRDPV